MFVEKLSFTKDWTDPTDFPTVETSEVQVRSDQQLLFNEIKDFLNSKLIPALENLGVETTVQLPPGAGFKYMRLSSSNELQVSADGENWMPIGGASTGGSVLYSSSQTLDDTQKMTARSNIGAVSSSEVTKAINAALGDYPAALSGLDAVIGGGT